MDNQSSVLWFIEMLQSNDFLKKEIPNHLINATRQIHEYEIKRAYLADDINRMHFELGKCDKRLNMDTYYQKEFGKEVDNE